MATRKRKPVRSLRSKARGGRRSFQPVKRPGAATAKAKREGLSVGAWAKKHYHDGGKTGEEARFVVISRGWRKGKKASARR